MQNIPAGPLHVFATRSRSVVPKAVNHGVPNRPIMLDQESLRQLDPHRYHDEITAAKILKAKILRLLNGLRMLH